ncbi:MAG: hypothetical protein R3C15_09295 [Thermoleophilia bacterium]
MADVIVLQVDEMEPMLGGVMRRARASLGVTSFGMQVEDLPGGTDFYPEHDESAFGGQEEVYTALAGSATLVVDGDEHLLEPGVFARVGPGVRRRIVPGPDGVRVLALGGVPGTFAVHPWTELGAPDPELPG